MERGIRIYYTKYKVETELKNTFRL